jgi:hypothetical protein
MSKELIAEMAMRFVEAKLGHGWHGQVEDLIECSVASAEKLVSLLDRPKPARRTCSEVDETLILAVTTTELRREVGSLQASLKQTEWDRDAYRATFEAVQGIVCRYSLSPLAQSLRDAIGLATSKGVQP